MRFNFEICENIYFQQQQKKARERSERPEFQVSHANSFGRLLHRPFEMCFNGSPSSFNFTTHSVHARRKVGDRPPLTCAAACLTVFTILHHRHHLTAVPRVESRTKPFKLSFTFRFFLRAYTPPRRL